MPATLRCGMIRMIGMFVAGWLAAHQWFLHHHTTLTGANGAHQFSFTGLDPRRTQKVDKGPPAPMPVEDSSTSSVLSTSHLLPQHPHNRTSDEQSQPSSKVSFGLKPSWHRLLDCSIFALPDCFASRSVYDEYPTFDELGGAGSSNVRGAIPPWVALETTWQQNLKRHEEISQEMTETVTSNLVQQGKSLGDLIMGSGAKSPPGLSTGAFACQAPWGEKAEATQLLMSSTSSPNEGAYDAALLGLAGDSKRTGIKAAFTMADKNYAHLIPEVASMASRHFLNVLLFACMDSECLAASCDAASVHNNKFNERPNYFRGAIIPGAEDASNVKSRVEHGKFWTAQRLAAQGTDFLFFEMDIWIVAPPAGGLFPLHYPASAPARRRLGLRMHSGQLEGKPPLVLLDPENSDMGAPPGRGAERGESSGGIVVDLLVSAHQDVPFSMNIGFFSVLGNQRTASFFSRLLALLKADPSLKDQRTWINLCRKPQVEADLWGGGVFGLIPPHVVASHTKPWVMPETVAIHVLSNRPLTVPHGKGLVAKELMAWAGSDGYYHDDGNCDGLVHEKTTFENQSHKKKVEDKGHCRRRRYLAFDGHAVSMNNRDLNHQPHYMRAVLGLFVSVAKATGRILILPAFFHDAFYFFAWSHLDLKTVESLGVEWRETNFLRTLRLRTRDTLRQQAMRKELDRVRKRANEGSTERAANKFYTRGDDDNNHSLPLERSIFGKWKPTREVAEHAGHLEIDAVRVAVLRGGVAISRSSSLAASSSPSSPWTFVPSSRHGGSSIGNSRGSSSSSSSSVLGPGFWPLLVDDPVLSSTPLLLLRFPHLDGASPQSLSKTFGAPQWVESLQKSLGWCNAERKGGMFQPKSSALTMSADDCFGLGKSLPLNKS